SGNPGKKRNVGGVRHVEILGCSWTRMETTAGSARSDAPRNALESMDGENSTTVFSWGSLALLEWALCAWAAGLQAPMSRRMGANPRSPGMRNSDITTSGFMDWS